jgi:hypothetical protein
MGLGQGFTKEPLRRARVPFGGKQKVIRLTSFVDRSIEIGPTTLHLDIGLIHPPRPIGQSQMRPKALLQLGGVCLKPPENRCVIDSYPAVLKHQLKFPVADRNIKYHRTAHKMISLVNCRPLNPLPSTNTGSPADNQSRDHYAPSPPKARKSATEPG